MTLFSKHNRIFEAAIYLVLWLLIFIFPVFAERSFDVFHWQRVYHDWMRFAPLLLIFFVHTFLLIKLFYRKSYAAYFALTLLFILIITLLNNVIMEISPFGRMMPGPNLSGPNPALPEPGPPRNLVVRLMGPFFLGVLTVAVNLGIRTSFRFIEQQVQHERLKKQNLANELTYLRHQISPHFFMNTLNNIHALVDQDKELAKSTIIRLSKLMRVVLYDSGDQKFPLSKEILFLQDYIDLMRIRVSDKVKIHCGFPDKIPEVGVPPLLFINFVENAFKHGIKAVGDSFIHVQIMVADGKIMFSVKNSIADEKNADGNDSVGIQNVRKRLDLLFGEQYDLQISQDEYIFSVELQIPTT